MYFSNPGKRIFTGHLLKPHKQISTLMRFINNTLHKHNVPLLNEHFLLLLSHFSSFPSTASSAASFG